MNREQILNTFKSLAMSQGFYGRLLQSIADATEEERDNYLTYLEEQNFKSDLDLIYFMEG